MDTFDIIGQLNDKHLNLPKIFELDEASQNTIFKLFDKLTKCFNGHNGHQIPGGARIDTINARLIYDTLVEYDYLITKRNSRLNGILNK